GPGVPGLAVDLPVLLGDVLGVQYPALFLECITCREVVADEGGIDRTIDDGVGDMDALRTQLTGHALGQCTQCEFGTGEGAETAATAQRGGGAGEDDGATPARQHGFRRFTAGERSEERRVGKECRSRRSRDAAT